MRRSTKCPKPQKCATGESRPALAAAKRLVARNLLRRAVRRLSWLQVLERVSGALDGSRACALERLHLVTQIGLIFRQGARELCRLGRHQCSQASKDGNRQADNGQC